MNYRTLMAIVAVLTLVVLGALHLPASLQAADQSQTTNGKPVIRGDDHQTFYVSEDAQVAFAVGQVIADDPENDDLHYRLSSVRDRVLSINSSTGQLTHLHHLRL